MAGTLIFVQPCPTCGRSLEVRVKLLGKPVVCKHCSATFEACDPSSSQYPPTDSPLHLLDRADALIQQIGEQPAELGAAERGA